MENTLALDLHACTNCGAHASKHYCANCGQKHRTPHELRIRHFLAHALEEFTHLDSKIFRSVGYVLFRPGKLTAEWIAGRERQYVRPLQLFIVMNVVYFLFLQFFPFNTLTTPLRVHYDGQAYSGLVRPIIDARVKQSGLSFEQFEQRFDETAKLQAKSLVIVMAPMFAAILGVVMYGSRRYYVEQLVFSLHYYSYFLIALSVGALVIQIVIELCLIALHIPERSVDWDATISLSTVSLIFVYLWHAVRRVYKTAWLRTTISALLLTSAACCLVFVYRFILFFTTIYTMHVH